MHRYNLNLFHLFLLIGTTFSSPEGVLIAQAQTEHPEVVRVRGFSEYKKQKTLEGKDRQKGQELHFEKIENEKREYYLALEEYRKQKRKEKPLEETPSYLEKIQVRKEERLRSQSELEEFKLSKKQERKQLEQARLNKLEELGLPEQRPRFDIRKRTLFGATSSFGKLKNTGSNSTSSPVDSGTNFYSPPPASFDEFPPPPSFPGEDNFDLPPPPPPPMPFDEGTSFNNMPFDEFPPPPPPPVDDFQF